MTVAILPVFDKRKAYLIFQIDSEIPRILPMTDFQNLERGEYWIIDAVWQASLSLSALTVENIEEAFNKEGHNLTFSELLDTLCRLFKNKYLIAYYSQNTHEKLIIRGEFIPN